MGHRNAEQGVYTIKRDFTIILVQNHDHNILHLISATVTEFLGAILGDVDTSCKG